MNVFNYQVNDIFFLFLNHAKNIFLQFLKQKKNQPDNGTYFEIGVAVLFQAAVFAFQGQLHWQKNAEIIENEIAINFLF